MNIRKTYIHLFLIAIVMTGLTGSSGTAADKAGSSSNTNKAGKAKTADSNFTPLFKSSGGGDDSIDLSSVSGLDADRVINDLFTVMAEIAINKAKSNTVNIIIKKVQKTFNTADLALSFPDTLRIINTLTVTNLSSSSQPLMNAFISDISVLMQERISDKAAERNINSDDLRILVKLFYSTMMYGSRDVENLMNQLSTVDWKNEKFKMLIGIVRKFKDDKSGTTSDISLKLLKEFDKSLKSNYSRICTDGTNGCIEGCEKKCTSERDEESRQKCLTDCNKGCLGEYCISKWELFTLLNNYNIAIKNGSSYTGASGRRVRLKAFSDLYFYMLRIIIADEIKDYSYVNAFERLVNARIDNNNREFVASVFDLIELTIKNSDCSGLKKEILAADAGLHEISDEVAACVSDSEIKQLTELLKKDRDDLKDIKKNIESAYMDLRNIKKEKDPEVIRENYKLFNERLGVIRDKIFELELNFGEIKDRIGKISDPCISGDKKKEIISYIDSINRKVKRWEDKVEVDKILKRLKRVKPLVDAVTAYSATYSKEQSDKSPSELKESRKQIIENLITETANRYQRYDEWIFSVGINTGFLVSYNNSEGGRTASPQLSLPLGLYLQYTPEENSGLAWPHIGFYFFDLGQYLYNNKEGEVKEATWRNAFTLGAQLGFFFASTPDMLFNAGFDFRYSPALHTDGTRKRDDLWFGVYCSYYVPFFDFN